MNREKKIKQQRRRKIIFYVAIFAVCFTAGYRIGKIDMPKTEQTAFVMGEGILETEQPEEIVISRYSVQLSDKDIRDVAAMVYLEARGESFEGQQAVAEVILNRVVSPQFPNTVHDVLYQKRQFSPIKRLNKVTPTETQYAAVNCALYGDPILPIEVVFFARRAENKNVWGKIGNHTFCYAYK